MYLNLIVRTNKPDSSLKPMSVRLFSKVLFLTMFHCLLILGIAKAQKSSQLSVNFSRFFSGQGFETKFQDNLSLAVEYTRLFSEKSLFQWHLGANVGNGSRTWRFTNIITNLESGEQFAYVTNDFSYVHNASQAYGGLGMILLSIGRFKTNLNYSVGVARFSYANTKDSHKEVYTNQNGSIIEYIDVFHRIDQGHATFLTHGPGIDLVFDSKKISYGLSYRVMTNSLNEIPTLSSLGIRISFSK